MTAATLPRFAVSFPAPSRFASFMADIFAGIAEGRDIADRYDALSRLTVSELASLGLSRNDISHIAATGVAAR